MNKEPKPVTRYWLLLVAVTIIRLIVYIDPVDRRQYIMACKKELWSLENI